MAIKTINKVNTKDEGLTNPVDCPVCNHNAAMTIVAGIDKSIIGLLKKGEKDIFVAVCPRCASVFSLNENYYNERKNGTAVTMTPEDLQLIVRGKQ